MHPSAVQASPNVRFGWKADISDSLAPGLLNTGRAASGPCPGNGAVMPGQKIRIATLRPAAWAVERIY